MKKFLPAIIATLATGCLVSSCKNEPENRTEQVVSTYNYVTHINDDGEPVIRKGIYHFAFDYIDMKAQISTDMVDLGDDEDSPSFLTKAFTFTNPFMAGMGDQSGTILKGNIPFACTASNGMEVKDLYFQLSPTYYVPPTLSYKRDENSTLPQPDLSYRAREGAAPRMRYRMGDNFFVYTFWPDLYYKGLTKTEVTGSRPNTAGRAGDGDSQITTNWETNDIGYRIKFDIKKKKATVVMYDVQFNPGMPKMECLILADLDVQFTNNGYIIEASNVAPLYIEGEKIMENPRFPFTSFRFVAETNMVECNAEFTVAGIYQGYFRGQYMNMAMD